MCCKIVTNLIRHRFRIDRVPDIKAILFIRLKTFCTVFGHETVSQATKCDGANIASIRGCDFARNRRNVGFAPVVSQKPRITTIWSHVSQLPQPKQTSHSPNRLQSTCEQKEDEDQRTAPIGPTMGGVQRENQVNLHLFSSALHQFFENIELAHQPALAVTNQDDRVISFVLSFKEAP